MRESFNHMSPGAGPVELVKLPEIGSRPRSTHSTAEGALLLALAETAAGVPFAGGFVRGSVGGYAAKTAEPDPILA